MSEPAPRKPGLPTPVLLGLYVLAGVVAALALWAITHTSSGSDDAKKAAASSSSSSASSQPMGPTQDAGPTEQGPRDAGAVAPTEDSEQGPEQAAARKRAIEFAQAYVNHDGGKDAWLRRLGEFTDAPTQHKLSGLAAGKTNDTKVTTKDSVVVSPEGGDQNVIVQGDKHALGITLTNTGSTWQVTDLIVAEKGANTYDAVWVR